MLWVVFTLLAQFLWTITSVMDKYVINRYVKNPMVILIFISSFGLISAFIISFSVQISIPPVNLIILSLFTGVLCVITSLFYFKSLLIEEVSRVTPLFSINSIFVLILATIFLNEIFTVEKYGGIFLIVLGSILISMKKHVKLELSKALFFMIVASLFWASYNVLLKFLLNDLTYWNAFFWTRIGGFLTVPFLIYFFYKPMIKTFKIVKKYPRVAGFISITEVTNIGATLLMTIALSIGYVSLVSALSQIHSLFLLILATILSFFKPQILKEELKGSTIILKLIAVLMIIFGAILLT